MGSHDTLRRRSLAVLLTGAWLALLWSPPSDDGSLQLFSHADKVAHFGGFLLLGLAWRRTISRRATFVLGFVLAVVSEIGQGLLPWPRTPDVVDLAFDVLGVVIGVLLLERVAARRGARAPGPDEDAS